MDIGTLLSALNKDMQANALFPNRPAGGGASGSAANAAAAAASAALAEAAAANGQGSSAAAAAAKAAAAVALAEATGANNQRGSNGSGTGGANGGAGSASGRGGAGGAGIGGLAGGGIGDPSGSGTGGLGSRLGAAVDTASTGAGPRSTGGLGTGLGGRGTPSMGGGTTADVYHSSNGTHPTPSLLAQSGVKAYTQLLSALSDAGHAEHAAEVLTNSLLVTSATLKSAYQQALATLPPQLQTKDWRFSISNRLLVFTPGGDDLSPGELSLLRAAFDESNVEQFANDVANAIILMGSKRSTGADMNSLAWGRFRLDDNNFDQVVDLRSYLTSSAPGSKYSANDANITQLKNGAHPDVPLTLGGMYLGDLVTARSDFFRPDIPARTDALDRAAEAYANAEAALILHGRCSCGEVNFTLENTLDYAYFCHCSRCRIRTGSAFSAIGGASIEKLHVTYGNQSLLVEGECSDGYGARCGHCYAFLFAAVRGRQYVHVSLGVLAGIPSRLPDHHIYVGSKAPWYQITDGLPQYDELPLTRG